MKIIISDFENGEVHIYEYDHSKYENSEDFLIENDFNINSCEWMTTSEAIIIH